ncbi:MAG: acetate--CoA ligase family protein [Myxococcota bacterium]
MRPWTVLSDDAALAVEIARAASVLGIPVDPRPTADLPGAFLRARRAPTPVALALVASPSDRSLVDLASRPDARAPADLPPLLLVAGQRAPVDLARELGFPVVREVGPLLALLALGPATLAEEEPWTLPLRALTSADRKRLEGLGGPAGDQPTRIEAGDAGLLRRLGSNAPEVLGTAQDVAAALRALRDRERTPRPALPRGEGADREPARELIYGPRRALSDPSSKAALAGYDVPLPAEELCASASRAAVEAARLGFPVRVALASPALRGWDHPELVQPGVESAARVRDVFRQLHALAAARAPDAPLLGVTVSADAQARALLRVDARLVGGVVLADLAFADPHGRTAGDRARLVLPTSPGSFERALRQQLRGAALLLDGQAAVRRGIVRALGDALLRLAAFLADYPDEVEGVTVDPLAVLVGGGVELREVCVRVSDAFERALAGAR